MSTDVLLVSGLVLAALSIPSILSAIIERSAPRASIVFLLIASGLIAYAQSERPGGYTITQIPDVFVRVVAMIMN